MRKMSKKETKKKKEADREKSSVEREEMDWHSLQGRRGEDIFILGGWTLPHC